MIVSVKKYDINSDIYFRLYYYIHKNIETHQRDVRRMTSTTKHGIPSDEVIGNEHHHQMQTCRISL